MQGGAHEGEGVSWDPADGSLWRRSSGLRGIEKGGVAGGSAWQHCGGRPCRLFCAHALTTRAAR
jgi:hypothetical protein